jgi:hypothetical protein
VVPLRPPSSGNNSASSGCVVASAANRNAIKRGPAGYYVNVHTSAFPNGAIRGQLKP